MLVEFINRSKTNRNKIVQKDSINTSEPRDYESYISLFGFEDTIKDHIEYTKSIVNDHGVPIHPNGTVSGYSGKYKCDWIYFDVDNSDLQKALHDTKELLVRIISKYGVSRHVVKMFFSGKKGFHIGIPAEIVGGINADSRVPYQVQRFVSKVAEDIESADLSIYNPNRFFRVPNSRHEASGLYKIPLSGKELVKGSLDTILELAKNPRPDFNCNIPHLIKKSDKLSRIWEMCLTEPATTARSKQLLSELPEDDEALFEMAVKIAHKKYSKENYFNHNRNNFMFYLSALCNDFGVGTRGDGQTACELITSYCINTLEDDPQTWDMDNVEATITGCYRRKEHNFGSKKMYLESNETSSPAWVKLKIMEELEQFEKYSTFKRRKILAFLRAMNATFDEPMQDDELVDMVASYSSNQSDRPEGDFGKTLGELAPVYIKNLLKSGTGPGLGIDFIDELERNDYSGRVINIIAKAGVGKSMLLQHIARHGAQHNARTVYSAMEDTRLRQFERMLASETNPKELRRKLETKTLVEQQQFAERLSRVLEKKYGTNIIIDEVPNMSKEDYIELMDGVINEHGHVNFLGIDGLSMMRDYGGEHESANRNSRDSKEIAKLYNTGVLLLTHVPRDVRLTQRNLARNARASDKIMDNGDAFISLSLIKDIEKSVPGDVHYYEDLVWMHYWGKRTGAGEAEKVFKITKDLRFVPQDEFDLQNYKLNL